MVEGSVPAGEVLCTPVGFIGLLSRVSHVDVILYLLKAPEESP
jgi:hypothetical protein